MLRIGSLAPDFSLPDQHGVLHKLSDSLGHWVLLYFYPKDSTPGCTIEACTLRDAWGDFRAQGAQVFGISKDSQKSHAKFAETFQLPFPILSDPEKTMITAYGAWMEKKMMGRAYMGIQRMSYLIDPAGKVAKVYPTVRPATHAQEVLADIQASTL